MEISSLFPTPPMGTHENPVLSHAKLTEVQKEEAVKSQKVTAKEDVTNVSDEARKAAVQQAAEKIKDTFVVSDMRFTIFKDRTGQYITRFTSLRDGSVTYIPEPDIIQFQQRQAARRASVVETKA